MILMNYFKQEAEHQKQLQEAQEHTLEEETEELNFNDY